MRPTPCPAFRKKTIQQIIAATDIVELIGRYVKLKRAGVELLGPVPLPHGEIAVV